ncbi:MAG: DUF1684 domain-containing protein [Thermomonas sp.]
MKCTIRIAALGLAVLAAGCQRGPQTATVVRSPSNEASKPMAQQDPAFMREEQAWRDQRRERLLQPDGWTSLIGLHWIDQGPHFVGSAGDNGIRLAMGPGHFGMIDLRKDGSVHFVPGKDAVLTLDGQPLKGATVLQTDADGTKDPNVIGFDEGKGQATVIQRGDRYGLRVKHADAPTRLHFAGLEYWPADAVWRVPGKFVPHPEGTTIQVANIIGGLDDAKNPGAVEFERDGNTYRIEAMDEGDGRLFLVFADRTNGHGSYGAGRFLYASPADAQGHVVLDFNQSYNPPCAFTSFATCPLPPAQNRLDLAIDAGEKAYTGDHGS